MANIVNMNGWGLRYSLNEEQFTGDYWIDGKKIYRTLVNAGNFGGANSYVSYTHNIQNIDNVVGLETIFISVNNHTIYSSGYDGMSIWVNQTNIQKYTTSARSEVTVYAIVKYTKTTETGV